MEKQHTIAHETYLEGIGLHTGNSSRITFRPAAPDTGIRFVRIDLPEKPVIAAGYQHVLGNIRGTTIGTETFQVHTVEHVLAVCSALGIDNMEILLTNNEPPVLDGSAQLFAEVVLKTGLTKQDAERRYYTLSAPLTYESGDTRITAYPSDEFSIDCTVMYKHPLLARQQASFTITPETFMKEVAPARTFCFDYEIEALKKKGLARGGNFTNAIVVGLNGIHNPDRVLRFNDEFVRHKMLDLIGDLYLLGHRVKARIEAVRCGHGHNINFAREFARVGTLSAPASAGRTTAPAAAAPSPATTNKEDKKMESTLPSRGAVIDINAIQKIIPHRYPFLMIDKVIITEEQKKATGFKCVSGNENFFQGHFPGAPIMPGVLIVEAMAQTSCVLFLSRPDLKNKLAYFMAIENVKFRRPVIPGDVLELRVEVLRARERGGKVRGEAYVDGALVTEADFMFVLVDREA